MRSVPHPLCDDFRTPRGGGGGVVRCAHGVGVLHEFWSDPTRDEAEKVQRLMRAKKLKRYFLEKIQAAKGEDDRREASVEEVSIMGRANHQEANSQEESEVECNTAVTDITNDNDSSERSKRKVTDVTSNRDNTKKGTKLYIEGNIIRRGVAKNMLKYLDHYVAKTDPN